MLHATRQHAMVVASLFYVPCFGVLCESEAAPIVVDRWKYDRSHWLRLRPT
jgi:hypothetical protein